MILHVSPERWRLVPPQTGSPAGVCRPDPPRGQPSVPGPETLAEPDRIPWFSLSQTRREACLPLPRPNPRTTRPGQPLGRGTLLCIRVLTRCGCSTHCDWKGWGVGGWSPACSRARHTDGAIYKTPAPCTLPESHTSWPLFRNWWEGGGPGRATPAPVWLSGGVREQGLSGVWRGGPQPELFGRCRRAGPCLSPRGLGTGGSRGLGAFPRRRWLTLAPQDVSVLPVLHPLLGQGSQTRVPPRPILYWVPTRGRKAVPDEYSMHGVNNRMHEGDVHEAGTRTPEALAPRTPDSGAGSWERPVADSSEGQSLSIGLAGSPPHLLTARPVTPS